MCPSHWRLVLKHLRGEQVKLDLSHRLKLWPKYVTSFLAPPPRELHPVTQQPFPLSSPPSIPWDLTVQGEKISGRQLSRRGERAKETQQNILIDHFSMASMRQSPTPLILGEEYISQCWKKGPFFLGEIHFLL